MKVSIITVCYQASSTIRHTIESVLTQSYPDIEYIIVDGKSTDGTPDIVNEYAQSIAHLVSEKDEGIYFAMNKGLALATGDLVGILNADDVYESPKVIEKVVSKIKQEESDAVY